MFLSYHMRHDNNYFDSLEETIELSLEDLAIALSDEGLPSFKLRESLTATDTLLLRVFLSLGRVIENSFHFKITTQISSALLRTLPQPLYLALQKFFGQKAIERISHVSVFSDEPYFPQYSVEIFTPNSRLVANGIATSHREAISKVIGEAVERYALSICPEGDLVKAPFYKLKNAIDPFSFSGPSVAQRQQIGWEQWRAIKDSPLRWVRGLSLISKEQLWVPAQVVYKPYRYDINEPIVRLPTTSGAAASLSQDDAILHGIAEVFEREAFLITYLNRLTPPRVNLKNSGKTLKNLAEVFKQFYLNLDVYVLPTDAPISIMLAVITDETGIGPAVSVGARAHFDPIRAVVDAVLEAHHTRVAIRKRIELGAVLPQDATEIRQPSDHALFWVPTFRAKEIDFLKGGKDVELTAGSGANTNLGKLLGFCREKGIELIWVKFKVPIFEECGLYMGKIIAPELHPLFTDERFPYYGGRRLYQLPVELGYRKEPLREEMLNHVPHPFP